MHPEAGDPSTFPAEVDFIDDSDAPNATNFNTPHQGTLNRTSYLYASRPHPGQNWYKQILNAGAQRAGAWDPFLQYWLLGNVDGVGNCQLQAALGIDDSSLPLQQLGSGNVYSGSTPQLCGVSADPTTSGAYWAAVLLESVSTYVTLQIQKLATPTSAWTGGRTAITPGGQYYDAAIATLGAYVIVGAINPSAHLLTSSNDGGATWHDTAPSWGAVPANTPILLKSNGSQACAVPWGVSSSPTLYNTTDGLTWTGTALSFIGAHDQVAGLCWNPTKEVWVLGVQTATNVSPPSTKFYSSPDGVTWTLIAAGGPHNMTIADLEAHANGLVCTLADQSTGGPSGQLFSPDGGTTWYLGQGGLAANSNVPGVPYSRSRLTQSPVGLMHWNVVRYRFSLMGGLPIALT